MLLGVIADDLTGATDVALMLAREGMRVVQTVGVPASASALPDADAVVVSMKSRTNPAAEAVAWSLAACDALLGAGARQILFKYCSTFDSTDAGQYRPRRGGADEAARRRLHGGVPGLSRQWALGLPGAPVRRPDAAVGQPYEGPSADADARFQPGSRAGAPDGVCRSGSSPSRRCRRAQPRRARPSRRWPRTARRSASRDAITDDHLRTLGAAFDGAPLLTGGSGIALGLPENFRRAGLLRRPRLAPLQRARRAIRRCWPEAARPRRAGR